MVIKKTWDISEFTINGKANNILSILGYQTVISPYSKAFELLIYAILGKVVPLIGAVLHEKLL